MLGFVRMAISLRTRDSKSCDDFGLGGFLFFSLAPLASSAISHSAIFKMICRFEGEKTRWMESSKRLGEQHTNLTGDAAAPMTWLAMF